MVNRCIPLLTFFLIFTLSQITLSQTVSVPLSHWAYDAIERWEVRGLISAVFNGSKPYTREEMGIYLSKVLESYQSQPEEFSEVDIDQIRYLTVEFKQELKSFDKSPTPAHWKPRMGRLFGKWPFKKFNNLFYTNHRNLLNIHHEEFQLFADPIFNVSSLEKLDPQKGLYQQTRTSNGFLFWGSLGNYFGFYFNLTDNHLQDSRWKNQRIPYEVLEESGWPYLTINDNGNFDFDENVATVTLNYKYFYLLYGREYNKWGIGHGGNLMLSTNAQLFDQIKLVVRYWRFKFTHITGFLEYIPQDSRQLIKSQPKTDVYWSGNRLELNLGKGWQLGLSEAVIYGNRSLQLGYTHPFGFFGSLEHFYGDRDNAVLGIDAEWRVIPGIKLFGEWFIDDITTSKLGSDFFGNKFGWQGGAFIVNPFSLKDVDFLAEYTRIKPFVYSQSFRDYNKYKQYDTILGHHIGPNSDDIFLKVRKRFSKFLNISFVFEQYRHGANSENNNVGGDPDLPHPLDENRDAPFLNGQLVKQKSWGGSVSYELLRNLFTELHFRRFQYNDNSWESLFSFRISFNFGFREEPIRNIFPLTR